jgi:hypothetical protein
LEPSFTGMVFIMSLVWYLWPLRFCC